MAKNSKKSLETMDDGDSAHWIKSTKKRSTRKASSAKETKKRFKSGVLKVNPGAGKKTMKIKK